MWDTKECIAIVMKWDNICGLKQVCLGVHIRIRNKIKLLYSPSLQLIYTEQYVHAMIGLWLQSPRGVYFNHGVEGGGKARRGVGGEEGDGGWGLARKVLVKSVWSSVAGVSMSVGEGGGVHLLTTIKCANFLSIVWRGYSMNKYLVTICLAY